MLSESQKSTNDSCPKKTNFCLLNVKLHRFWFRHVGSFDSLDGIRIPGFIDIDSSKSTKKWEFQRIDYWGESTVKRVSKLFITLASP
jgi:hypothetical protein